MVAVRADPSNGLEAAPSAHEKPMVAPPPVKGIAPPERLTLAARRALASTTSEIGPARCALAPTAKVPAKNVAVDEAFPSAPL